MDTYNDDKRDASNNNVNAGTGAAAKPSARRRWPWVVAGVLVALFLLVAFLPVLLSTGPGRRVVLGQVNKGLNGSLEADDWSLRWFSGVRMQGLHVRDARGESVARVASARVPAGLLSLLGSTKDLGTVEVDEPQLDLVRGPDGTWNIAQILPPSEEPRPLEFDLAATFKVTSGSISVRSGDSAPLEIRNFDAEVKVPNLADPFDFAVSGEVGAQGGKFSLKGNASVLKDGVVSPRDMVADVDVKVDSFELGSLAPLARAFGAPVTPAGRLDAGMKITAKGPGQFSTSGDVKVSALALNGDVFRGRTPQVGDVSVAFDGGLEGSRANVRKLDVTSSVARMSLSGDAPLSSAPLAVITGANVKTDGSVDLAGLARLAPDVLKLAEGTDVRSGRLTWNAVLGRQEGVGPGIDLSAKVADVEAMRAGRTIRPRAPIELSVRGALEESGPRVEALTLTSSFATVEGSGTLERMSLSADADLAAAAAEVGQFVDLGERTMRGKLTLTGSLQPDEGAADLSRVALKTQVQDLSVSGVFPRPLALAKADVDFAARARLDGLAPPKELQGVKLTVDAAPATVTVTAATLSGLTGLADLDADDLELDGRSDLAQAGALLRSLGLLPDGLDVQGTAALKVEADMAGGKVDIASLRAQGQQLVFIRDGKKLREEQFSLSARGTVDMTKRSISLPAVATTFTAGKLDLADLKVPDWSRPLEGTAVALEGRIDTGALLKQASDFVKLPAGTVVAGVVDVTGTVKSAAAGQALALKAGSEALKLDRASDGLSLEEAVALELEATKAAEQELLTASRVALDSRPVKLAGTGTLRNWSQAPRARAKGTLGFDFERLSAIVKGVTGQDFALQGASEGPFDVDVPLGGDWAAMLTNGRASYAVDVKHAAAMGVDVSDIKVSLKSADGVADMSVTGTANGGQVVLTPQIVLEEDKPVLKLEQEEPVLAGVGLTVGMANSLLARAAPFFKGALQPAGKVDFTVQNLSVPLAGAAGPAEARAAGTLGFEDVTFKSSGGLGRLLGLVALGDKALTVPNQDVGLALKDGRFQQETLRLAVDKYALEVGGSVGLDKSLDYTVALPITEELAGDDKVYRYLKDSRLKAGVVGTLDNWQFKENLVRDNISNLVREAARKALLERLFD